MKKTYKLLKKWFVGRLEHSKGFESRCLRVDSKLPAAKRSEIVGAVFIVIALLDRFLQEFL